MNNAGLLVSILRGAGRRHTFEIPSGSVLRLMEAMCRGGIEFVLTPQEGYVGHPVIMRAQVDRTSYHLTLYD